MATRLKNDEGDGGVLTDVAGKVRAEADAYRAGEERPLGGYAVLIGIYGAMTTLLGWVVRRRGYMPDRIATGDIVGLGIASHKLSRILTKDPVSSVGRLPFTRFEGPAGEGEIREAVRGTGVRHAVGELVTCPFCIAMWVATGLAFGLVLAPRATRLVTAVLTAVAASDYLQLSYAVLQRAAQRPA